jgi:hypothetical protein
MTSRQGERGASRRGRESGRQHQDGGGQRRAEQRQASSGSGRGQSAASSDLKQREYRDEQGNIHHHTRTYMEQHGRKKEDS